MLCAELADILAFLLPLCELLAYHFGEKLLGLDEGYLDVAVRVAVEGELAGDVCGEGVEDCKILCAEVSLDIVDLVFACDGLRLVGGEGVIELCDELLDGGDELDETFWDKDCTEVVALLRTCGNDAGDVVHDVVEALLLLLDFLRDEADVGLGLERAFEGDMAGAAAHQLDEVPVFAG